MRIAVPTETDPGEARVAATPETVRKFAALGAAVAVESGAGLKAGYPDSDYRAAGAVVESNAAGTLASADIVLKVRRPNAAELAGIKRGAVLVGVMDPYGQDAALAVLAQAGVAAFAMELLPRITRAQSMDVLSSQANLAGYRAVVDAAAEYGRALPMMMTAAGTVPAAKVFVMGVGVAGLQAIATARRLGAVVTATDVRPATKEQVESLGAKFIAVEDQEFREAETEGGYAKEMSGAYQAKQSALVASHIAKQDIVITTALIPGRPAPRLVTSDMVRSMRPGSVIVDLAVERGGNCELSRPGEVASVDGVKIVGHLNMAGRLAATASALYARNLFAFVETMIDKKERKLAVDWQDELVRATCLTREGAIVHPNFRPNASSGTQAMPSAKPASAARSGPETGVDSIAPSRGDGPASAGQTGTAIVPTVIIPPAPAGDRLGPTTTDAAASGTQLIESTDRLPRTASPTAMELLSDAARAVTAPPVSTSTLPGSAKQSSSSGSPPGASAAPRAHTGPSAAAAADGEVPQKASPDGQRDTPADP